MIISDGLHLVEIFKNYTKCTGSLKYFYPEVDGAAMNFIVADTGFRFNLRVVKNITKLVVNSLTPSYESYPRCDAIFFNSSNKLSFGPALNELANRLSKRGWICGVLSYDSITILNSTDISPKAPIPNFYRAKNVLNAIYALLRGLYVLVRILFSCRNSDEVYAHVTKRFLAAWLELAYSYLRSKEARNFLCATELKLFITHNEKIPISNEIVMCCHRNKIQSIYYFCEHPDAMVMPVYSKEVWVWSSEIKNSLMSELKSGNMNLPQSIRLVGHHESDLIIERMKSSVDLDLPNHLRQEKIFIFISEYVKNKTWQRGPPTKICVEWLSMVANALPGWLFVFKGRPYQSIVDVPGFNSPKDLPSNLILYQGALSLGDLLSSRRIAAAGALGSLGLFAAARSGIPSFRFKVTEVNMPMQFLDELAVTVNNPKELVSLLKKIDIGSEKSNSKLLNLPYRGKSLDQMETLAWKHLSQ
jgi:hypothetical protein